MLSRGVGGSAFAAAVCAVACAALALPAAAEAARPRPPVVLIVFDEFPTTSLLGKHRSIDRRRFPNFAALAGDATWFRNATTVHDSTFASIPAILTGRPPRYLRPPHRRPPSHTILRLLARRGYRIRASVEARDICPPRLCPRVRSPRYFLVRNRLAAFRRFISSLQASNRPTVWYRHSLLPHLPWIYLPSGNQYQRGPRGVVPGINGQRAAHDPYLVRLAYQRHMVQVTALDRLIGEMVAQLRRAGLYDRSLIVITADHGISFRLGENDRRQITRANFKGVAPVPLFVKRPGQRRGRISSAYTRGYDVAPTIASLLRIRIPWRTSGRSVYSRAVRGRRTVRIAGRHGAASVLKLSARSYQAGWSRAIRYQHFLFGFGGRGPGLYGIGPNTRLLGRPLTGAGASLRLGRRRIARRGPARARLRQTGELRNVNLGSRFRPTLINGTIRGGRGRRRNVAIAVNGRVVGVGRSFHLRGSRTERFAVLVPETALVHGFNRVHVVAVARRGRRFRFRLLGAL